RSEAPTSAHSADLKALFQNNYARVWGLLRRFGVPAAELDDQAQEVFWVAARRFSDLQPGRETAFLYGVALRVASNAVRRGKAAAHTAASAEFEDFVDPRPSPEEQLGERQARQLLDQVLDRMPLELRTAFVLFELEGISVSDIAELEGIPVGTASSRLRRARQEFSALSKRLQAELAARGARS
ncbi:MAG: sigma-70 family RNA polymerase sigma factor, partial [Pseudomonadota bacterium]